MDEQRPDSAAEQLKRMDQLSKRIAEQRAKLAEMQAEHLKLRREMAKNVKDARWTRNHPKSSD